MHFERFFKLPFYVSFDIFISTRRMTLIFFTDSVSNTFNACQDEAHKKSVPKHLEPSVFLSVLKELLLSNGSIIVRNCF